MIFDEATSALDYESERVIRNNMKAICEGRTVIIVAHRLSAVRIAHRIVVMDQGQIVESGTHAELLGQGGLLLNPASDATELRRGSMNTRSISRP